MSNLVLNDRNIFPDKKVLTQYLGNSIKAWESFIDLLKIDYPQISTEWRYYNDGKSWLFKVTKKAKTICWVSVWDKYFKVTCYFNNRAEELIKTSILDATIKKNWLRDKKNSNLRPITIEVRKISDLKTIKIMIELKESFK
jgi:hypothetical protein